MATLQDVIADYAYGTVATAPSPALTGLTFTLAAGEGAEFPAGSFDVQIWPVGQLPLQAPAIAAGSTAEQSRATISGDTLTLSARGMYGTPARAIQVGDLVCQPINASLLNLLLAAAQQGVPITITAGQTYEPPVGQTTASIPITVSAGGKLQIDAGAALVVKS